MSKEIVNQVESIIETLESTEESYVCECCGHTFESDLDECPECHSDDIHEFTAYDYLSDIIDVEYVLNSSRECIGARILVAAGGPNIWINTRTNQVEGYWWGDTCIKTFDDSLGINNAVIDLFNC